MIRTFSSLYAGHVDFEDMGQYATPVNERRYSNEHLITAFDKTQAMAQLMDQLGYDIRMARCHRKNLSYLRRF